jgi:hypothetical protein
MKRTYNVEGLDLSEWNPDLHKGYKFPFVAIRSNDGTYRDHHFSANHNFAHWGIGSGNLAFYGTYFMYHPNWRQTISTFFDMVGRYNQPFMYVTVDLERGLGGMPVGNHQADITACREWLITRLNGFRQHPGANLESDRRRVCYYGNAGDLETLIPNRGDANIILADYSGNPHFPNEVMHQFTDHYDASAMGLGQCDLNSADNTTVDDLAKKLGVLVSPTWSRKHAYYQG